MKKTKTKKPLGAVALKQKKILENYVYIILTLNSETP